MPDRINPILDAMVGRVAGLNLRLNDLAVPVVKGKLVTHRDGIDAPAHFSVTKSAAPEVMTRWTFKEDRLDLTFTVSLIAPYQGPAAGLADYSVWRDAVWDLFRRPPLPGADDVFDLRCDPGGWMTPPGERSEWDRQTLDVTASVIVAA